MARWGVRRWHRLLAVPVALVVLNFAVSGIILNYRATFDSLPVSRALLPPPYQLRNWNNSLLQGGHRLGGDSLLLYGRYGLMLTDTLWSKVQMVEEGMPRMPRRVAAAITTPDSLTLIVVNGELYRYASGRLHPHAKAEEGLIDLAVRHDTLLCLSRSALYWSTAPYTHLNRLELKAPPGVRPEVTLFQLVWDLHSGALFGTVGTTVVNLLALLLATMALTGLLLLVNRLIARGRSKVGRRKRHKRKGFLLRIGIKHLPLGRWLLIPLLLVAITGTMLRPPLMLPIVLTQLSPEPGDWLYKTNAWDDRLRRLALHPDSNALIISTKEGFYRLTDLLGTPERLEGAPPISVMGCSVLEPLGGDEWLIGSFAGLFRWNMGEGRSVDYFTGAPPEAATGIPLVAKHQVDGYVPAYPGGGLLVDYNRGAEPLDGSAGPPQPDQLASLPMSLWSVALEMHTGRLYGAVVSVWAESLFIFFTGLLTVIVLVTGYRRYRTVRDK